VSEYNESARARGEDHASELLRVGATHVILEAREAALPLGEAVLVCAGLEESAARDPVVERREATKFIPAAYIARGRPLGPRGAVACVTGRSIS